MPQPLVLIVDDAPDNLSVVGELLLPRHAVRVANGGWRALQLARLAPLPDLILLDVMMPGIDGFEVLRALRADPLTAEIPVILLTALGGADDEERGLLLGADDYVTKPLRPAVLLARIGRQLALRAAARQQRAEQQRSQALLLQLQAQLRNAQDATLQAMRCLQQARAPASMHQQLRLQAHLRSLCQALRHDAQYGPLLDERQVDLLLQAALVHDIGLLAVPDHVLAKPGPLDAAERAVVQRHCVIGARALGAGEDGTVPPPAAGDAPWLPWAQQIARHHHERWDGRGYPDGLAGQAIPWMARLLAVADTYESLTATRPHRPAFSHAAASALIADERGGQFDPDVADAFLDCSSDWPAVAQRHG
ncbi:MAG TPA: response regulator [Aquabacterium sp.]|nr:response regulator [Aquabacterium sp.]